MHGTWTVGQLESWTVALLHCCIVALPNSQLTPLSSSLHVTFIVLSAQFGLSLCYTICFTLKSPNDTHTSVHNTLILSDHQTHTLHILELDVFANTSPIAPPP